MNKDKFLNNAYSLLIVATIILLAGMMYVNISNTEFAYSDSPQVNPDVSPKEEQRTLFEIESCFMFWLLVSLAVFVLSARICGKQRDNYDAGKIGNTEHLISEAVLLTIGMLSFAFAFSLFLLIILVLLFEVF